MVAESAENEIKIGPSLVLDMRVNTTSPDYFSIAQEKSRREFDLTGRKPAGIIIEQTPIVPYIICQEAKMPYQQ